MLMMRKEDDVDNLYRMFTEQPDGAVSTMPTRKSIEDAVQIGEVPQPCCERTVVPWANGKMDIPLIDMQEENQRS